MKASIQLYFTTSKTLAYLILIIGTIYSFVFSDSNVLIATFAASSAVIATKTFTQSKIDQKNIEFRKNKSDIG